MSERGLISKLDRLNLRLRRYIQASIERKEIGSALLPLEDMREEEHSNACWEILGCRRADCCCFGERDVRC